ncbi:MAG: heavy metal-binding domain-containing protein [Eggerthellaceae bacterium]|nr:heavy metal-binding domain-containing protein [Eggerthellaceae bacterium]
MGIGDFMSMKGLAGSAISSIQQSVESAASQRNAQSEELERKQRLVAAEEQRIADIVRTMPITSGPNLEGYRIVRYAGYVSGDEVATIPRTLFLRSMKNDAVNDTIKQVRNVAIRELKEAAANLDCNAVIGLDFDYITLDSGTENVTETKIVLTANGTAVEIVPIS